MADLERRHNLESDGDSVMAAWQSRLRLDVDVNLETGLPEDFISLWGGEIGKLSDRKYASHLKPVEGTKAYIARRMSEDPENAPELMRICSKPIAKKSLKTLDKLSSAYKDRVGRWSMIDRLSNWEELQRICFDAVVAIKGEKAANEDSFVKSWHKAPSTL